MDIQFRDGIGDLCQATFQAFFQNSARGNKLAAGLEWVHVYLFDGDVLHTAAHAAENSAECAFPQEILCAVFMLADL